MNEEGVIQYKTKSSVLSSILGSIAAAVQCEEIGNLPIDHKKIIKKIENIENKINY